MYFYSDKDVTNLLARCGDWDTQDNQELKDHQSRQAKEITIHPGFNDPRNIYNDFAIIIVENDFNLTSHIDTVCLPNQFGRQHCNQACSP